MDSVRGRWEARATFFILLILLIPSKIPDFDLSELHGLSGLRALVNGADEFHAAEPLVAVAGDFSLSALHHIREFLELKPVALIGDRHGVRAAA